MIPSAYLPYIFAGLFGLVLGSFLNVCIARLPRHESVVTPRSRCPQCGKLIRWYDNIPVISYLILRGRCRNCRQPISPLYPAVELITAALFVGALAEFGPSADFIKAIILSMLMVVLIFTDFNARIIPHSVTISGVILGLVLSFFVPVNDVLVEWILRGAGIMLSGPLSSFIGAVTGGLFGAGLLYGVAWCFQRLGDREKEYLGFGDVMLMLMAGVFLGIPLAYVTILLGSVAGTAIALSLRMVRKGYRGYQWPYGSFLAAAAIFAVFRGQDLIMAYLHWSRLG
ncbi:MAG: prepilin peptidase [Acidobacteriota bacterium]|nr:prepilin peptidase [Acidobacteriota bacterium]